MLPFSFSIPHPSNATVLLFFSLTCFTQHNAQGSIRVVANGRISSALAAEFSAAACAHRVSICLPVGGHFGCSCKAVTGDSAAVNSGRCGYLVNIAFSFPLDTFSEVKVLDPAAALFLTFLGPSILFSTVAAATDIPSSCAERFALPAPSPTSVVCGLSGGHAA